MPVRMQCRFHRCRSALLGSLIDRHEFAVSPTLLNVSRTSGLVRLLQPIAKLIYLDRCRESTNTVRHARRRDGALASRRELT